MIGKLSGMLDSGGEDWVLIDVGGVGYVVSCSTRTLRALPRPGEPVRLLIETHMREDRIQLFGFAEKAEQQWFQALQTVQGVGARLALAILSALSPGELSQAILFEDKTSLTRAAGVGAKLAARLVTELKDRAGSLPQAAAMTAAGLAGGAGDRGSEAGEAADAISALVNLGYRRAEAFAAVAAAARDLGPQARVTELIRSGLKELGR